MSQRVKTLLACLDSYLRKPFDIEESADGSAIEVYTHPGSAESVRESIISAGFQVESADLAKIPQNNVELEEVTAIATLRMLEQLDDLFASLQQRAFRGDL